MSFVNQFIRKTSISHLAHSCFCSYQVNYVAAGCRLFEAGETADFGGFSVAARALSLGYLWDNVSII